MARQYAPIHLSIWNAGSGFRDLSVEAQHVYLLAVSQPRMTYCGVVPYQPRLWASLSKGNSVVKVKKAVGELATKGYVLIDQDTEELWVRTFVKHNKILEQGQLLRSMIDSYDHIASSTIKAAFYLSIPEASRADLTPPWGPGCPPPFPPAWSGSDGKGLEESALAVDLDPDVESEPGPSPLSQPEPSPEPEPTPQTAQTSADTLAPLTGDAATQEIATLKEEETRVFRWADLYVDKLGFTPKQFRATESLMRRACVLDDRVLDECLNYLAGLEEPPKTVRYVETALVDWAAQRGVAMLASAS